METKEKILRAASEAFASGGFHAATIRGICSRAGVNVAAVNYHFSNKNNLYEKVFEYLFDRTDSEWLEEVNLAVRTEDEWFGEIRHLLRRMLEKCTSRDKNERNLLKLLAYEELDPSENFPSVYEKFIAPRIEAARKLFSFGVFGDETELDICVLGVISLALLFGDKRSLVKHFTGNDNFGGDNLDLILDSLMSGIRMSIRFSSNKGTVKT